MTPPTPRGIPGVWWMVKQQYSPGVDPVWVDTGDFAVGEVNFGVRKGHGEFVGNCDDCRLFSLKEIQFEYYIYILLLYVFIH